MKHKNNIQDRHNTLNRDTEKYLDIRTTKTKSLTLFSNSYEMDSQKLTSSWTPTMISNFFKIRKLRMGLDKMNNFEFHLTKRTDKMSTKHQHQTKICFLPLLIRVLEKEQFYLKMWHWLSNEINYGFSFP